MCHLLMVQILQPLGGILELSEGTSVTGRVIEGSQPYKLKPVHIPMRLSELGDCPI